MLAFTLYALFIRRRSNDFLGVHSFFVPERLNRLSLYSYSKLINLNLLTPTTQFGPFKMTNSIAIRTTLTISFTLLLCNSIVQAQDDVPAVVENQTAPTAKQVESLVPSTNVISTEKAVDKLQRAAKKPNPALPQVQPGERVTNPDHLILNLDTTLGGIEVKGTKPIDYGYKGPGDMRTHLWNAHSSELIANGITENRIMAMTVPEVQQWHNFFHGVEGSPEHHDDDDHASHASTIVQPTTGPASSFYFDELGNQIFIFENSEYVDPGFPQPEFEQPEIIYEGGFIIQGPASYEFETEMQQTILNP